MVEASAGPTIIRTKLNPPARGQLVARLGLVRRLVRHPRARVTLVTAPAGWGKSTLVADWAASPLERRRFAWVGLEATEDHPVRFWLHVVESLRQLEPTAFQTATTLIRQPGTSVADVVVPAVLNALAGLRRWCSRWTTCTRSVTPRCWPR